MAYVRHLRVSEVAGELCVPEAEVEGLLMDGRVRGFVDTPEGRFKSPNREFGRRMFRGEVTWWVAAADIEAMTRRWRGGTAGQ